MNAMNMTSVRQSLRQLSASPHHVTIIQHVGMHQPHTTQGDTKHVQTKMAFNAQK